jgi:CubicO group peptidase (beta-lactamase class C family)
VPPQRFARGGFAAASLLIFTIAACESPGDSRPALVDGATFELQRIVDEIQRQSGVPALAAAWVRSDGVIHAAVAGRRALGERRDAMNTGDRVRLGSVTNQFVAGTVLVVIKDNPLRWNSTVGEVLKDLAPAIRPEYRSITIEELLTGKTAIPPISSSDVRERTNQAAGRGSATDQREALVRWALGRPPSSAPGAATSYPDVNHLVAAHMGERATRNSFEGDLDERLFKRIGRPDDCAVAPADTPDIVTVPGHVGVPAAPAAAPADNADVMPAALAAVADVRCSISSLAQYARIQIRALRGLPNTYAAFTPADIQRLYSGAPRVGGRRVIRQTAGAQTFAVQITLMPDDDLAVVVAANAGFGEEACARATEDIAASLGALVP